MYVFAEKRAERCDVLRACDILGLKALRLHRTFERCDPETKIDGLSTSLIEIAIELECKIIAMFLDQLIKIFSLKYQNVH